MFYEAPPLFIARFKIRKMEPLFIARFKKRKIKQERKNELS
jgi:hypothetical protein